MTDTSTTVLATVTLLGIFVGAFINALVHRVRWDEASWDSAIGPLPCCAHCREPIQARHNVPVIGWLLLRGRCPTCGDGVSARYLLIEVGTAALFAAVALRFGLSVQLPAYLFLTAMGVALALIDLDSRRLPNSLVLPTYVVSALLLMPAGAASADWRPAERALIGVLAMQAIYFALALAQPATITFGDVKLAGIIGLYLGWLSWDAMFVGAVGGLLVGGLSGMLMSAKRGRHGIATVAFGPCIFVAASGALFVTAPLIRWYGSLVGAT